MSVLFPIQSLTQAWHIVGVQGICVGWKEGGRKRGEDEGVERQRVRGRERRMRGKAGPHFFA